jgi:diguanylate cyclase (GGDEF)-like protein
MALTPSIGGVLSPASRFAVALLVPVLLLGACLDARAEASGVLRLETHGPDQGLPQSTVKALATDDQGFLWVATQDGLARFDGHRFQVWRDGEDDGHGLVSVSIDALAFEAATRDLWLGTNDAGLEVVHLPTWSRLRLDKTTGLAHNQVTALALDGDGGAWVGGGGGLDHVTADGATVRHLGGDVEITGVAALAGTGVALALGRDCRLWRATRTTMDLLATLPSRADDCVALRIGPEGIWAASEHAGVLLLDLASGEIRRRLPLSTLLPDAAPVTTLLRRRDGSLLVGMRDGRIARLASASAAPALLRFDQALDNPVTTLHEDAADSLWVGTYTSGLHYARPLSSVVQVGSSEAGAIDGWPRGSMRAIWRGGDHVLLGFDGGLYERRAGERRWREIPAFEGQSVRAITRSAAGGWWIGTQDGLFRWTGHGAARPVPGLPDNRVDALLIEGDSGWIGTRGGLARLREGQVESDPLLAPLRRSHITALLRNGSNLWIATNADGLWQLQDGRPPSRVHRGELHHSLWSLLAQEDALWVGSYSRGIHRIDRTSGKVATVGQQDGLGNNVVYSLLSDDLGRLWASTNNGLSVLDPANATVQVLGPRDGLANREYNSGSAFRGPDGLLYFGGTRGIDVLDPSGLPRHSPPARPVLTTLRVAPLDAKGEGPRETDIVYARNARLEHRDRMVTIRMTAIDFAAPDAAQLRYRVLGLHQDWVHAHAPVAEFSVTALPPGSYVLEVEAAGRDGRFGQSRTLRLDMAPPWWRHPLAYAAYCLALLLLLALVARRVDAAMRRERRQVELLERTVAERTAQLQLANQRLSRTNAQLSIATRRDPLTRISNRRDLQEWLGREAAELRRRLEAADDGHDRLVFLMIDIDDFKRVNDVYGHQAGDEVLVHFADRLRLLSREDDLLVRWGGEEFLLISRFTRMQDAAVLAERIRAAIAGQPIRIGRGVALDLTCSIGFAPWPFALEWPELGDWSACVGLADRCLYAVKRSTKNGWLGVVPGDAPRPDALQALLAGAHPDDVGPDTVQVLHSASERPRLVQ